MRTATVARAGALLGSGAITIGSLVAALGYTGVDGEPYSPLTHWVSELGERGVSDLAEVFNVALVIGGLGFVLCMVGLAVTGRGAPRWGYGPIGVVAGIAGALVGIFPMNDPGTHRVVASLFFNLGWIAVALASIPIGTGTDTRFPRWLALVGAGTVAAFIAFLAELRIDPLIADTALGAPLARPGFWLTPTLEWLVIGGILAWTLLVALTWRVARPVVVPPWEIGA